MELKSVYRRRPRYNERDGEEGERGGDKEGRDGHWLIGSQLAEEARTLSANGDRRARSGRDARDSVPRLSAERSRRLAARRVSDPTEPR